MEIEKYINRFIYLHELIAKESTGNPTRLANKLSVSERMMFEYLTKLRESGAVIKYSRVRATYYYSEPFSLSEVFPSFRNVH